MINQQGLAKGLRDEASEALHYLESRERFWRQQNPLYSRKNFTAMLKAHAQDVAIKEVLSVLYIIMQKNLGLKKVDKINFFLRTVC